MHTLQPVVSRVHGYAVRAPLSSRRCSAGLVRSRHVIYVRPQAPSSALADARRVPARRTRIADGNLGCVQLYSSRPPPSSDAPCAREQLLNRKGELIGEDANGNKYYENLDYQIGACGERRQSPASLTPLAGRHRWVVFADQKGYSGTSVTPDWHGAQPVPRPFQTRAHAPPCRMAASHPRRPAHAAALPAPRLRGGCLERKVRERPACRLYEYVASEYALPEGPPESGAQELDAVSELGATAELRD